MNSLPYSNYIEKILIYWFKNKKTTDKTDFDRWFIKSRENDDEIKKKFRNILKEAEKGNLLEWLIDKEGYLAHIILMDQFSRQIYRDKPKAFKNDNKILFFMEMGLDNHLHKYNAVEKMFILMPYQHKINKKCQRIGAQILKKLYDEEVNVLEKKILREALKHQLGHLNVLKKFNRFPKRNYIMRRSPTEEEIDYMDRTPLTQPY